MTNTAMYALESLHRSLERVRSYTHLPFNVRASTRIYVDSLLPACTDPSTGLFDLLFRSKHELVDDAIITTAVPNDLLGPLQRLRSKRDELQLEKESAIRDDQFCDAVAILDQQRDIDSLISKLVPGHIAISPDVVVAAIRLLGYTGPLPGTDRENGSPSVSG
ncbi:hypothetical protein RMSM_02114 [Rhodopirellula maiorica SM1]|uniref:Uncharacterized protein n=1 Tax=Rhodopirellula maiorica SM1 TaxID=1265738 RepID=M5RNQ3_9BACT|nr:hypothetical protein RMSM_02114 [Rhodopirellula maiorica SM1]